jgi:hypothetical protein
VPGAGVETRAERDIDIARGSTPGLPLNNLCCLTRSFVMHNLYSYKKSKCIPRPKRSCIVKERWLQ